VAAKLIQPLVAFLTESLSGSDALTLAPSIKRPVGEMVFLASTISKWRATADEDGHYTLAIPL
jgi:hypothetical protein